MVSKYCQSERRATRGSTMVEALIVITMIAVFVGVLFFLHSAYIYKLAAMRDSRAAAWQASVAGCHGGLSGGLIATAFGLAELADTTDPQTPSLGFSIGANAVAKSHDVAQAPSMGGRQFTMTSQSRVACNEVDPGFNDLASVFQWGYSELIP